MLSTALLSPPSPSSSPALHPSGGSCGCRLAGWAQGDACFFSGHLLIVEWADGPRKCMPVLVSTYPIVSCVSHSPCSILHQRTHSAQGGEALALLPGAVWCPIPGVPEAVGWNWAICKVPSDPIPQFHVSHLRDLEAAQTVLVNTSCPGVGRHPAQQRCSVSAPGTRGAHQHCLLLGVLPWGPSAVLLGPTPSSRCYPSCFDWLPAGPIPAVHADRGRFPPCRSSKPAVPPGRRAEEEREAALRRPDPALCQRH